MNAGELRQRVTIQEPNDTRDALGGLVAGWSDVATVWAKVEPVSGREIVEADAVEARITHRVVIRWRDGLRTDMRAVFVDHPTSFTADADTDILTWAGRTPHDGEMVWLSTSAADLPAPLAVKTDYYLRDSSGASCKLATTRTGSALNLTDAGTGTHYMGWRRALNIVAVRNINQRDRMIELLCEEAP